MAGRFYEWVSVFLEKRKKGTLTLSMVVVSK